MISKSRQNSSRYYLNTKEETGEIAIVNPISSADQTVAPIIIPIEIQLKVSVDVDQVPEQPIKVDFTVGPVRVKKL